VFTITNKLTLISILEKKQNRYFAIETDAGNIGKKNNSERGGGKMNEQLRTLSGHYQGWTNKVRKSKG
jgi:hypothetical protein